MPKQPALRPSYKSDAKYFRRLIHAIEHDIAKPDWWRNQIISRIQEIIHQFEGADDVQEKENQDQADQKEADETKAQG